MRYAGACANRNNAPHEDGQRQRRATAAAQHQEGGGTLRNQRAARLLQPHVHPLRHLPHGTAL